MRIHLKLPGRWGRVSRYLGWLGEALIKPVVSKCYCRHAYIPLTKDGSFWHWRVIDPGAAPRCLNLNVYLLYKSDWNVCLHRHRVVTSNNIRPSFQSKFYGPSTYYQLNRLKFRETKPELGHFRKAWFRSSQNSAEPQIRHQTSLGQCCTFLFTNIIHFLWEIVWKHNY